MVRASLTLLIRSLRQDSRSAVPHVARAMLLVPVIWMIYIAHSESSNVAAPGLNFFMFLSALNVGFITLAGLSIFASAITEEKEDQTLGLLRMAGIGPVALLLGKSTSRLINAVVVLGAQIPFTLLAVTLGGVTPHQVYAAYLAQFAYLLALANLALFSSVLCRTSRGASWMTGLLTVVFFTGPWVIIAAWEVVGQVTQPGGGAPIPEPLEWVSRHWIDALIVTRLREILQSGFAEPLVDYQFITNAAAAALFFFLAWLSFGPFVGTESSEPAPRGFVPTRLARDAARRGMRRINLLSPGRVWPNALVWKDFHFLAGGTTLLLVKFAGYGLVIALIFMISLYENAWYGPGPRVRYPGLNDWNALSQLIIQIMLLVAAAEVIFVAGRVFNEEWRRQTYSTLMLLPRSLTALVFSKITGCLLGAFPAVTYLAIGFAISRQSLEALGDVVDEPGAWLVVSQFVLLVHLIAFFSILTKWGAIPLAAGLLILTDACCVFSLAGPGRGAGSGDAVAVVLCFVTLVACVFIEMLIGERLKTIAAQ